MSTRLYSNFVGVNKKRFLRKIRLKDSFTNNQDTVVSNLLESTQKFTRNPRSVSNLRPLMDPNRLITFSLFQPILN